MHDWPLIQRKHKAHQLLRISSKVLQGPLILDTIYYLWKKVWNQHRAQSEVMLLTISAHEGGKW